MNDELSRSLRAAQIGRMAAHEQAGMQEKARYLVYQYAWAHLDKTDAVSFGIENVYVVWFCKTLQNWKALLSTTLPDSMYYEITYDGDKKATYIDAYRKFDNIAIPDKTL